MSRGCGLEIGQVTSTSEDFLNVRHAGVIVVAQGGALVNPRSADRRPSARLDTAPRYLRRK
jgi:hypothetical protein